MSFEFFVGKAEISLKAKSRDCFLVELKKSESGISIWLSLLVCPLTPEVISPVKFPSIFQIGLLTTY